jgi:outer membrane protein TolC
MKHLHCPIARNTTARHLLVLLLLSAASPVVLPAQESPTAPPESEAPLLTLDEAVSLALGNNRSVKHTALDVLKSDELVAIARSRRYPQFHFDVLAGSLLQPFDFTFPAGSFGTYPGIGPIPGTDAKITTPAQFTTFATAALDQPLTQLRKINLGIELHELGSEIAGEELRATRQKVTAEVRSAYFDLVAAQTAIEAAREAWKTLNEVQRVTAEHEAQQTVLRADALEVDARLAKSKYDLSAAENRLATRQERINDLLGRDLTARFRVAPIPEHDATELTLESARQRALGDRPEIRQSQLKERQAECDRRLAKAEYIPDLSFSVRYMGFNNFEVLPRNVESAGLYLSWEPFDWGRRRHRVAEKSQALDQARIGAQQTLSQVALEVGMKYRRWSEAALLVPAARTEYEAAREQLRVMANRYREEAALLKDLLQSQSRTTQAEFQYQQALSAYWGAVADLRRAMGEE